jgi:hypothetical protein
MQRLISKLWRGPVQSDRHESPSESFIEIAQEIIGRESIIVQNFYYGKCTGKRDFTLHNFLFRQNMYRNLKFPTAEKSRLKKKQTFFAIGPVVFAPRTQTYVTEQNEYGKML